MAMGPIVMPGRPVRPALPPPGPAPSRAAGPGRRRDPDHEALANARLAALREQRPRFETSPHRVDVYL